MDRLTRRLGVPDAVVIGLGSMLGAGIFVVFAPAAAAAGGTGLLVALALAGFIAFCNATSSARLAARYPESGGTYVYGRERLDPFAGFLAGWGFVIGKTASCAAMALTIGAYLWPGQARLVAVLAVVAVTAVNLRGIGKTAAATRILVVLVLAVLALVAVAGATSVSVDRIDQPGGTGRGVLTAAGLLFFAFAGYARIATLGEEVRDPQRTIPRAVPLALGLVLVIYLVLGVVAVGVLGADRLAASAAPLADVVGALAMARHRDLPAGLAAVHPRYRVPHRAELAVAAVVILVVVLGDVRGAIGFSACTVLVYYAITNAAALTLGREPERKLPVQALAVAGLVGCVLLAVNLPLSSVLAGFGVLALGAVWYALRSARR
ncbi:APC family permease [Verrucosispora sioxanthis]|uniref:APC family permease n=1 Tax=Verrucosispora sioxanthis TaxID=2499994 RepID=UPI001C0FCAEC|nr:APC family permease [Verrucosispora sioxanthis]